MTLNLNENALDAKKAFNAVSQDENATPEQINDALEQYVTAISEDASKQVKAEYEELKNVTDRQVLQSRGIHALTPSETKFYNEVEKAGGFDNDLIWPETIIDRVFDDLQEERPLLKLVNFAPSTATTKIIKSRRKGVAVFGPLHKDLEGQLDAEFGAQEFTQIALTAFFLISNDTLDLGPTWIDRYVRLCLGEAVAEAWEAAIVNGNGHNQPIGLMKDMDASIDPSNGYSDKKPAGTLTLKDAPTMVKEFAEVLKTASKFNNKVDADDEGEEKYRNRKIKGNVYLLINPVNYWDIVARVTTQNANGVFVTNLPFIAEDHIIESLEVPENKLVAFVAGQYDATQSRPTKTYVYDQTFAMKRATLYAIDMLANGQPANNDAAQVYDIKLAEDDGEDSGEDNPS